MRATKGNSLWLWLQLLRSSKFLLDHTPSTHHADVIFAGNTVQDLIEVAKTDWTKILHQLPLLFVFWSFIRHLNKKFNAKKNT